MRGLASLATTFMSNVATASILLPVVAPLASTMRVHPLFFLAPGTLSTSLAFVLPVSTPPNALAFASGRLAVSDMAPLGIVLTLVCILLTLAFALATGHLTLGMSEFPEWATATAGVAVHETTGR